MRRVRARRRAICTCMGGCARGAPWHATWPCMWAMACGSACNLPNARCAGVPHLQLPLQLPLPLHPLSFSLSLSTFPDSIADCEPTFALQLHSLCDTVAVAGVAGVASSINAAADLFQQSTINLH